MYSLTRIGVVGPDGVDDFAYNIAAGISDLGLEPVLLGKAIPALPLRSAQQIVEIGRQSRQFGAALERHLLGRILSEELDLVITVVSLRPETVEELKRRRPLLKIVLWFPDAVSNLGALWMFEAPYDALFFKDSLLVSRLSGMVKPQVHHLPEACNPHYHRIFEVPKANPHVVVVGNLHPLRTSLLERLAEIDIPLKIYGPTAGLRRHPVLRQFHQQSYVRGEAKAKAFRSASCVLNNLHPAEMTGVNCRLFEAAASGAAVVSEYRPEVPTQFKVDHEVLTYSDYEELVGHLTQLVSSPDTGVKIGDAASIRALSDHTYAKRLASMLELLN